MKRWFLLTALAMMLCLTLMPLRLAQAQMVMGGRDPCRQFAHTSHMCITNASPYTIVGVAAGASAGWIPPTWLPVPNGMIAPGQTAVVTFNTWGQGCWQYVFIHTTNPMHATHSLYTNVCAAYKITIPSW